MYTCRTSLEHSENFKYDFDYIQRLGKRNINDIHYSELIWSNNIDHTEP